MTTPIPKPATWSADMFDGLPEPLRSRCLEAFERGRREAIQRREMAKDTIQTQQGGTR